MVVAGPPAGLKTALPVTTPFRFMNASNSQLIADVTAADTTEWRVAGGAVGRPNHDIDTVRSARSLRKCRGGHGHELHDAQPTSARTHPQLRRLTIDLVIALPPLFLSWSIACCRLEPTASNVRRRRRRSPRRTRSSFSRNEMFSGGKKPLRPKDRPSCFSPQVGVVRFEETKKCLLGLNHSSFLVGLSASGRRSGQTSHARSPSAPSHIRSAEAVEQAYMRSSMLEKRQLLMQNLERLLHDSGRDG